MLMRPLGDSGTEASAVALGTWAIGGWMWGGQDEADSIAAIHAALDEGITLIDTAPVYGFGLSEEVVGRAIAGRRDGVVLATKCGLRWDLARGDFHFNSDAKGRMDGSGEIDVYKYLAPESIREEVERSLKRLGTDRIDLLQTHWQDSTTPIADTMGELMRLKDEGKIRAIGASNATVAQLEEYRAAGQLDVDQERYSILDRGIDDTALPFCAANHVAVLAYSPLALGLLTGKITPAREYGAGDLRAQNPRFSDDNIRRVNAMLDAMADVRDRHGLTQAQLTIAWTLQQPGLTHTLVGARNPRQAAENAAAGRARLTQDDLTALDRIIEKHVVDIR